MNSFDLVEAAPDGTVLVDAAGLIVLVNHQVEVLLGFDRAELVGRPVEMLVPPEVREGHHELRAGYLRHPRSRPMGASLRLRAVHASGELIPVEISLSPIIEDDETFVIASIRDVRDRNAAQDSLQRLNEALAVADDRERIARDLHDTVIQRMFASGLSLQAIATSADEPVRGRLIAVVDDLDVTIRELRTAVFRLKQHGDQSADVRNRLLGVITEATEPLGYAPRFRVDGVAARVPSEIADELVAVAREALSNVARHARATAVTVSLSIGSHDVSIIIEDDGFGMPSARASGLGLANLASRATRLDGHFEAGVGAKGGTSLSWSVPLDAASASAPRRTNG